VKKQYYGGIEAGGTKFICAIGLGVNHVLIEEEFPTTTPRETLARAIGFFQANTPEIRLDGIGIASFGPIDLATSSDRYGFITTTPKPGWQFTDMVGPFQSEFGIPVGFDTDTNAAALAEYLSGSGRNLDSILYLTIGTGIGGGAVIGGKCLHGLMHPEIGHMRVPHDWKEDPFPGVCPFHGDCLEGLAAGPALHKRWGMDPAAIPQDHPAWDLEAKYLALGLANSIVLLSPKRIYLGGGVGQQMHLFPRIRSLVHEMLNGYIKKDEITRAIEEYIVPPSLGRRAGIYGAFSLAGIAAGLDLD
jgi:fructokinase